MWEVPIRIRKCPFRVWVDLSGYWIALSGCVLVPFLGVGVGVPFQDLEVACKNVAVSCQDVGLP